MDTTFINGTVIASSWLNDVNNAVYFKPASSPPSTRIDYHIPWVTYRGTGVSDSAALQSLLTAGYNVQIRGTVLANNLIVPNAGQRLHGVGQARVIKDSNGPLITFSADDQEASGIEFRGDAATPVFTGVNVRSTGENFRFINSGSRWAHGHALVLEGGSPLVLGTCDIIQTANGSTSYDIYAGVGGVAKLYGRILGIKTSQASGGIYLLNTGSFSVTSSQFGKLTIAQDGTPPVGVNGGNYLGNRILGTTVVGTSSSTFSANTFSNVSITFASGTSGHSFTKSNVLSNSAVLVDNSNVSNVVDNRKVPPNPYVCSWTGATTNPSIGNGTITSYVSTEGKQTTVQVTINMGTTTTFGSGQWYFSLPVSPNTSIPCIGQAQALDNGTNFRIGTVQTLLDGSARCILTFDSDAGAASSTRPFSWATGDALSFTLTYWS